MAVVVLGWAGPALGQVASGGTVSRPSTTPSSTPVRDQATIPVGPGGVGGPDPHGPESEPAVVVERRTRRRTQASEIAAHASAP